MLNREIFEQATRAPRFSISLVTKDVLRLCTSKLSTERSILRLNSKLGGDAARVVVEGLVRNVFFIEPVNASVTSTKYAHRWLKDGSSFSDFSVEDPRGASFEECEHMFVELLDDLSGTLDDEAKVEVLNGFLKNSLNGYELPLDYLDVSAEDGRHLHRAGNLKWVFNKSSRTIKLRQAVETLTEPFTYSVIGPDGGTKSVTMPLSIIVNGVLRSKIEVKTYKTDRAQTGNYKTNREKRWEAHPRSVQFASRAVAWGIEFVLLNQMINFSGFPSEVKDKLVANGLADAAVDFTRCPITGDLLEFKEFAAAVMSPVHGRSDYQVGHLNPLKRLAATGSAWGHTPENIAWISADGNRIQGSLSHDETIELLRQIWRNHHFGEQTSTLA